MASVLAGFVAGYEYVHLPVIASVCLVSVRRVLGLFTLVAVVR